MGQTRVFGEVHGEAVHDARDGEPAVTTTLTIRQLATMLVLKKNEEVIDRYERIIREAGLRFPILVQDEDPPAPHEDHR